jgi:transposase InsO family protein
VFRFRWIWRKRSAVKIAEREKYLEARSRIISDNGLQFIARDFKEFIRISGMTHVRTSPFYPQSNGKIERWHKSLKGECIRPGTPLSPEDVRRLVQGYVEHYNNVQRLGPYRKHRGGEDARGWLPGWGRGGFDTAR